MAPCTLPMQGAQFQSLVGELRSHVLHSMALKKTRKKWGAVQAEHCSREPFLPEPSQPQPDPVAIPGGWGLRGGSWGSRRPSNEAAPGLSPPASPGMSLLCPLAGVSWAASDRGPALGVMQEMKPHPPSQKLAQGCSARSRSQTLGFLGCPPPPTWDAFPIYRLLAPERWGHQACIALPPAKG